jgi:hypothetical protein
MMAADMQIEKPTESKSRRGQLWALTVELWIFLVLACFFVVRVLGSEMAGHILGRIHFTHAQ